MTEFLGFKRETDVPEPLESAFVTVFQCAFPVADKPRPSIAINNLSAALALRDATERHDGQMLPAAAISDVKLDNGTRLPSNESVRFRTRRTAGPTVSRLEPRSLARRERAEVDLVGRASTESRVRPLGVVPGDVVIEFASEGGLCQWDSCTRSSSNG